MRSGFVAALSLAACAHGAPIAPQTTELQPSAGVHVSLRIEQYRVEAPTFSELRAQMRRLGPVVEADGRRYPSRTWGGVNWHYGHVPRAGGCGPGPVTVDVQIIQTFPRCESCTADDALGRSYRSWLAANHDHENEHRDIITRSALAIERAIAGAATAATCDQLDASIQAITSALMQQQAAAHVELDARTHHGATTSSVLRDRRGRVD
jgi:predicted secreted Zn-dependent protease